VLGVHAEGRRDGERQRDLLARVSSKTPRVGNRLWGRDLQSARESAPFAHDASPERPRRLVSIGNSRGRSTTERIGDPGRFIRTSRLGLVVEADGALRIGRPCRNRQKQRRSRKAGMAKEHEAVLPDCR
jgi:hypothetical protein